MQHILLSLSQALYRRIIALGLMVLVSLSGLFILVQQPSYAVTSSRDKISSEDKIERAYQFRTGTGFLEEERQEKSPNKEEAFDPSDKANVENAKTSRELNPEPSLGEQVQKAVKKVVGKE